MSPADIRDPEIKIDPQIGKEIKLFERLLIRKDGKRIPVEISIQNFHYKGRATSLSIVRDVSERQKALEALKESENRFRELFDNMSSGVAVYETVDKGQNVPWRPMDQLRLVRSSGSYSSTTWSIRTPRMPAMMASALTFDVLP